MNQNSVTKTLPAANAIRSIKAAAKIVTGIAAVVLAGTSLATNAEDGEFSPPVANDYPNQVFWGDTHLHTNQSPDAFTFGNRTITPEKAYRFARGETIVSQLGVKARLAQPLDFLMVSDHSEFMGVFPKVFGGSPDIMQTPLGQRWASFLKAGTPERVLMEFGLMSMGVPDAEDPSLFIQEDMGLTLDYIRSLQGLEVPKELSQSVWDKVGETADEFYQPGHFTTFIGYEWTSMPDGNNLHRNVLFRDSGKTTSKILPFSSMDSNDPEDLWAFLAKYETETGGKAIAIPHNGNVSNGLMFAETTLSGDAIDKDYAERRSRWEPVIEMTQIKGDGETHPFLSPNDEFANYESWDRSNLSFNAPKKDSMYQYEYARQALRNGLAIEQRTGANPYQFGMIGATDSHTGLATGDEDNFFGKSTLGEPKKGRATTDYFPVTDEDSIKIYQWESAASGYAAVWARENTREALFDAMQRREVYATTGPRITVRFFAGWNFAEGDDARPNFANYAYANGVPMGSELAGSADAAPTFIVSALKDPMGAHLDRIQVIKGWVDADGNTHEQVYNVAASDDRKIRKNKLKPVGNTVDVENATYRNSIGDPALSVVWQDPDFDPGINAFYYARVLEIPTPRWTTYDAAHYGDAAPESAPDFTQERAYTSPIWYRAD